MAIPTYPTRDDVTDALAAGTALDFAHVADDYDYDDENARADWRRMTEALDSGDVVEVHASVYDYFLDALPPRHMRSGGYVFAEGDGVSGVAFVALRIDGVRRTFARAVRPGGLSGRSPEKRYVDGPVVAEPAATYGDAATARDTVRDEVPATYDASSDAPTPGATASGAALAHRTRLIFGADGHPLEENEDLPHDADACHCPACGSHDVDGGAFVVEDRTAYQDVTCRACGSDWTDAYDLNRFFGFRPGDRLDLGEARAYADAVDEARRAHLTVPGHDPAAIVPTNNPHDPPTDTYGPLDDDTHPGNLFAVQAVCPDEPGTVEYHVTLPRGFAYGGHVYRGSASITADGTPARHSVRLEHENTRNHAPDRARDRFVALAASAVELYRADYGPAADREASLRRAWLEAAGASSAEADAERLLREAESAAILKRLSGSSRRLAYRALVEDAEAEDATVAGAVAEPPAGYSTGEGRRQPGGGRKPRRRRTWYVATGRHGHADDEDGARSPFIVVTTSKDAATRGRLPQRAPYAAIEWPADSQRRARDVRRATGDPRGFWRFVTYADAETGHRCPTSGETPDALVATLPDIRAALDELMGTDPNGRDAARDLFMRLANRYAQAHDLDVWDWTGEAEAGEDA